MVSDDGWSIVCTHGFMPEIIAVDPAGRDVVRVRLTGDGAEHHAPDGPAWAPERMAFTTAGLYWSGDGWPYFAFLGGTSYFCWRTWWGQRLVIDLTAGRLIPDTDEFAGGLADALTAEEGRQVLALLSDLAPRMAEVITLLARPRPDDDENTSPNPLVEVVRRVRAALHMAGIHKIAEAVPYLRAWEEVDYGGSATSSDILPKWWLQKQRFRPIAQQALKRLGESPTGLAAYHFVTCSNSWRTRTRRTMPEVVPDRAARIDGLKLSTPAHAVLDQMGSPDFVRTRSYQVGDTYEWTEEWDYDIRTDAGWRTLRLSWKEIRRQTGKLITSELVSPDWLHTLEREKSFLGM